jgi:outer membrane receptor protein involved in Fe transport
LFNNKFSAVLILFLGLPVVAGAQAQDAAAAGTIAGTVYDAQTGRPLTGVLIAVDGQIDLQNVTNSDGKFSIRATPGTHALRFTAQNYIATDTNGVVVTAGEVTEASKIMSNENLVQSIEVVETLDAVSSTAEAMLIGRKLSSVVSDSVGRQELSEGTSGDAAGALEKVTGVSVVGDGFVYVRGLGERYSATQLNGSMIPTTEPEKRVVPLDLFPSGMIDNITIAKTYAPDLPAEFSGGMVQLQTMEFPSKPMLTVSWKGGFNTATTFSPFLTHPGSSGDFWGFGKNSRAIPRIIGDQRLVGGNITRDQFQEFGRAFSNSWEPTSLRSIRPALDWSVSAGNTFGKLGLTGAVSFSNKPQFRSEVQRYIRQGIIGDQPGIFTEYPDFREYSENARLGGVLNAAYRFNPNNKLVFRNTMTHDTEKSSREFSGYDGGVDGVISSQRLRFIERQLLSSGLDGEHVLSNWGNSLVHWQFTYSSSQRDEPDLREVIRNVLAPGRASFASNGSSGIRFFSDLDDRILEPQVDYAIPFFKGTVAGLFKVGIRATLRRRDFQARRFRYIPQQSTTLNLLSPSNQLFTPENIRPTGFEITEYTRGTDKYDARMDIYAGYAMVDLSLGPKWRVVTGIRVEDADQFVRTVDNQIPNAAPAVATLQNRDPVPAFNLIYAMTQTQNIRASYSRTISRPDFRELSPFDFTNVLGGFITTGNPALQRTSIQNYDLRWEMFPGGNQLVAASVFAKTFDKPIEQTVLYSNDLRQSFINAKNARNYGFELEFRHNMGSFAPGMREFSLSSNFTFVESNVEINPANAGVLTTRSRPLVGQSRYVFNGTIQWTRARWHSDARFFSNYVSRRITDLGTFGVPDIYQEPTTTLDFSYQYTVGERRQWAYRFEAENLSNNDFQWTQGPFTQRQYRLGRTFQIGVTYAFF